MYSFGLFILLFSDDTSCPIRGAIINNKQVEGVGKCQDGVDHLGDVLPFVVGGYDNYAIALHIIC